MNKSIVRKIIISHKSGGGFVLPNGSTFENWTIPSKIIPSMEKSRFVMVKNLVPLILGQKVFVSKK